MKIISLSDTHSYHRKIEHIPEGDVIVHAGDISHRGEVSIITDFIDWFSALPHKYKIFIAGNHDLCLEKDSDTKKSLLEIAEKNGIFYLQDSSVQIDGIHFYGSPFTPLFHNWAFNLPRGKALADKWASIPENTNVLITHGPPYQILDQAPRGVFDFEHVGCKDLLERIFELPNLKVHIFGHIHNSSGIYEEFGVKFVNSAICTESYKPTNLVKESKI